MITDKLPLVSIVTPAYNQAEYLAETIESVLAQDYPNIEYIILNDGSADGTEDVLKCYSGRLKWETQKNIGQAATLNKGWGIANGKYVGYLSSDDLLYPTAISELVMALERSPGVGVSYCDFDIINNRGVCVKKLVTEEYSKERLAVDLICQPGVGALFRRDFLSLAGGWSTSLRQVPDFDFWLRMADYTPFKRVGKVLGAYRVHDGSASFSRMAVERANEITFVMDSYWEGRCGPDVKKSKAKARIISAKNHAQSLRPVTALVCFSQALALHPGCFFELGVWRMLLSGFFRGVYYKFL